MRAVTVTDILTFQLSNPSFQADTSAGCVVWPLLACVLTDYCAIGTSLLQPEIATHHTKPWVLLLQLLVLLFSSADCHCAVLPYMPYAAITSSRVACQLQLLRQ